MSTTYARAALKLAKQAMTYAGFASEGSSLWLDSPPDEAQVWRDLAERLQKMALESDSNAPGPASG